jgi:hypothetical protein
MEWFKMFKPFNRYAPFKPPTYFLPHVVGELEEGKRSELERLER